MTFRKTISLPFACLLVTQPCSADLFPDGDFENGLGSWFELGSGGTFAFSYPTSGGNPDGYGIIDNSAADGGFGIWISNNEVPYTLDELGLVAGNKYKFTQDMQLLSGPKIGGFKLDFTNAGENVSSSGELFPDLIGDGSTWETYTFEIDIPADVDGFKVVPLWGAESSVAYDNIGFDPTPILPPVEPPVVEPSSEPQLSEGTLVTWVPTNSEKFHQPQSSQDGTTWTDLGPAFLGTETTTILDPDSAPFHRVQEKEPAGEQAIINGDFEIADAANPDCPESWACLSTSGQLPTRIESDASSGSASIRIAVQNDDSGSPNQAEIQQNLINAGGFVTPGESYTFSFSAKQISYGVSYVQNYSVQWVDGTGAVINGAGIDFTPFDGGDGSWAEISVPNLVAPASAGGVFIQIFGATGAVPGVDAKGEVLIDNISLSLGGGAVPVNLDTTTEPGIGITQLAKSGVLYKAQQSEDLQNFTDLTGTFTGNGQAIGAGIPDGGPSHFFRVLEIPIVAD